MTRDQAMKRSILARKDEFRRAEPEGADTVVRVTSASRPRFGFPRRVRLTRRAGFTRVFEAGSAARGALFTVRAAPNTLGFPRLGISVSRAAGISVARNRMKRLLREAFRLGQGALPRGFDLVVVVSRKPPREALTLARFSGELARLAREAAGKAP